MLIISIRQGFDDPDRMAAGDHETREIDLAGGKAPRPVDFSQLIGRLRDRRVLFSVHGSNNEQFEVYDAYERIEGRIADRVAGGYDELVGYSWPRGGLATDWCRAKSGANAVAYRGAEWDSPWA